MESSQGRIGQRRPRDADSRYLLPGFARCGCCGGGFGVVSRQHSGRRVYFYACVASWKRGQTVCANGEIMAMERADDAVLQTLAGDVLRPAVVAAVIEGVCEALQPRALGAVLGGRRAELVIIEREIGRPANRSNCGWSQPGAAARGPASASDTPRSAQSRDRDGRRGRGAAVQPGRAGAAGTRTAHRMARAADATRSGRTAVASGGAERADPVSPRGRAAPHLPIRRAGRTRAVACGNCGAN